MDSKRKAKIESAAWDATVGTGNYAEVVCFAALELTFVDVTEEDRTVFRRAWARCIQSMEQP